MDTHDRQIQLRDSVGRIKPGGFTKVCFSLSAKSCGRAHGPSQIVVCGSIFICRVNRFESVCCGRIITSDHRSLRQGHAVLERMGRQFNHLLAPV